MTTLLDEHLGRSRLANGLAIETGVPFGHKVALHPIRAGEPVIKYGLAIGHAIVDISRGAHVHVHNVR
ncbi:MAG: UxaA family hydrolase [Burkholderiaceae bacterium]